MRLAWSLFAVVALGCGKSAPPPEPSAATTPATTAATVPSAAPTEATTSAPTEAADAAAPAPPEPSTPTTSVVAPASTDAPVAIDITMNGLSAVIVRKSEVAVMNLVDPSAVTATALARSAIAPAGEQREPRQVIIGDAAQVVALLSAIVSTGEWRVDVWRGGDDDKWPQVLSARFASKTTPILLLGDNEDVVAVGGYGARKWKIPAEPDLAAEPTLVMPERTGWWLPDGSMETASRIVELPQKRFVLAGAAFTSEGGEELIDIDYARPVPAFANAAVLASNRCWVVPPLDAKEPLVIGWEQLDKDLTPLAVVMTNEHTKPLALNGCSVLLVHDTQGLVLADGVSADIPLPRTYADATLAALADASALLVRPDGSVHVVPISSAPDPMTFTATTELAAVPAAFRPLFDDQGFALEGTSTTVDYNDDEKGKTSKEKYQGSCKATRVEVSDGIYHAEVACTGLDVDYGIDFAGHWYATADGLRFAAEPLSDRIALMRSPIPVGIGGGCVASTSGVVHPESRSLCFDENGPESGHWEGGPAAQSIKIDLTRKR